VASILWAALVVEDDVKEQLTDVQKALLYKEFGLMIY